MSYATSMPWTRLLLVIALISIIAGCSGASDPAGPDFPNPSVGNNMTISVLDTLQLTHVSAYYQTGLQQTWMYVYDQKGAFLSLKFRNLPSYSERASYSFYKQILELKPQEFAIDVTIPGSGKWYHLADIDGSLTQGTLYSKPNDNGTLTLFFNDVELVRDAYSNNESQVFTGCFTLPAGVTASADKATMHLFSLSSP